MIMFTNVQGWDVISFSYSVKKSKHNISFPELNNKSCWQKCSFCGVQRIRVLWWFTASLVTLGAVPMLPRVHWRYTSSHHEKRERTKRDFGRVHSCTSGCRCDVVIQKYCWFFFSKLHLITLGKSSVLHWAPCGSFTRVRGNTLVSELGLLQYRKTPRNWT